ncbi:response regulator, partial [Nocardia gipuzkoensis]
MPDIDTVHTTAILADDNALVRMGLRAVLTDAGITVLAEVATEVDLLREAMRQRPDVLVLGTVSPGAGETALQDVSRAAPNIAILLVNAPEDAQAVRRALRAGVRGYLPASADSDDIARAVSVIAAGWAIFSRAVLSALTCDPGGSRADCRPFPELTTREFEVLDLVAAGLRNSTVAQRL